MINISVLVRNEKQLKKVLEYPVHFIYTDNYELIEKYPELYYQVPRVSHKNKLPKNLLVGDVGVIWERKDESNMVADYFLNVANHASIEALLENNIKKITLSIEATTSVIESILKNKDYPIEIIIYGRIEDMMLKKHPIIETQGYSLRDYQGHVYPIVVDESQHVHLFHSEPIQKIKDIDSYIEVGVKSFRLDFLEETEEEIATILNEVAAICQKFTK